LLNLGDSVTTDHISPAGSINRNSPAARYWPKSVDMGMLQYLIVKFQVLNQSKCYIWYDHSFKTHIIVPYTK
jgi:hypothetical protein